MKKQTKPSQILRSALALFGPTGKRWFQGGEKLVPGGMWEVNGKEVEFPKGAFCAIGAMKKVNAEELAIEFLAVAIGGVDAMDNYYVITEFNDEPKRTFKQVKAKFLEAIKLAKAAEANPTIYKMLRLRY